MKRKLYEKADVFVGVGFDGYDPVASRPVGMAWRCAERGGKRGVRKFFQLGQFFRFE
jgi:hypothetical protein